MSMEENTTYDLANTDAMADLRNAFASENDEVEEGETPVVEAAVETIVETPAEDTNDGAPSDVPDASADPSDEEISRLLAHPQLQSRIRDAFQRGNSEAIRIARMQWEADQARQQAEEDDALLDDEEFGRRQREQQRLSPVLTQAQQSGYARAQQDFFNHAVTTVWTNVEELRSLPESEKRALDPTSPEFKTYGEYINRLVDVAATKRAEARASVLAEDLVTARVASELAKLRKGEASPRSVSGPASGPGPIVDVETMTGSQLLTAAFSS